MGLEGPQIHTFLDLWKELIPGLKFLFIWRKADDVVDSLVRRSMKSTNKIDKISVIKAYLLWKYQNRLLLDFYLNHQSDSVLVSINKIIENNRSFFDGLVDGFKINLKYFDITELVENQLLIDSNPNFFHRSIHTLLNVNQIEKSLLDKSLFTK